MPASAASVADRLPGVAGAGSGAQARSQASHTAGVLTLAPVAEPPLRIDPATLDKAAAYHLMISAIVPRPIAWVGSRSAAGVDNLAPFSYFMGVASAPPMLAFSVARGRAGALKHTARNLLEHPEFTVSTVEEHDLEPMHRTGGAWEESEFDAVGIPRGEAQAVRAPYPATARVRLECRVHRAIDLGPAHLFVGEVVAFEVDDALWADGAVRIEGFHPVARLGGDLYAGLGALRRLPRGRVG